MPTDQRRTSGSRPEPTRQEFDYAAGFKMPFGKYRDRTLNEVAADSEDERGLLYLDWLVGREWVNGRTREAIETFLAYPPVARDVEVAVERDATKKKSRPARYGKGGDQARQDQGPPW